MARRQASWKMHGENESFSLAFAVAQELVHLNIFDVAQTTAHNSVVTSRAHWQEKSGRKPKLRFLFANNHL